MRPVPYVMRIAAAGLASGEPALPVAGRQRPARSRTARVCSLLRATALRRPGRSRGNVSIFCERAGVDVHYDLVAVARGAAVESAGQGALGHHSQCIRLTADHLSRYRLETRARAAACSP